MTSLVFATKLLQSLDKETSLRYMMPASKLFSKIRNPVPEPGRPVLTFGGFLGQYNEISVEQLAALVKNGQLRSVLRQNRQGRQDSQDIAEWVQKNCRQVSISGLNSAGTLPGNRTNQVLYDCGG